MTPLGILLLNISEVLSNYDKQKIVLRDVTDFHSGQVDVTRTAYVISTGGEEIAGYVSFAIYNDIPSIQYIKVSPKFSRTGVAHLLLDSIQKEFPDKYIEFGMSTDDGTHLLDKITKRVPNQVRQDQKKELEELKKEEEKLSYLFWDSHATGKKIEVDEKEKMGNRLNDISDRIYELENLINKSLSPDEHRIVIPFDWGRSSYERY